MMHAEAIVHLAASAHNSLERSAEHSPMQLVFRTSSRLADIYPDQVARSVHATEGLTRSKDLYTSLQIHTVVAEPCSKKTNAMERRSILKSIEARSPSRSYRFDGFVIVWRKRMEPTKGGHAARWVGPGGVALGEALPREHRENRRRIVWVRLHRELYRCSKCGVRPFSARGAHIAEVHREPHPEHLADPLADRHYTDLPLDLPFIPVMELQWSFCLRIRIQYHHCESWSCSGPNRYIFL